MQYNIKVSIYSFECKQWKWLSVCSHISVQSYARAPILPTPESLEGVHLTPEVVPSTAVI